MGPIRTTAVLLLACCLGTGCRVFENWGKGREPGRTDPFEAANRKARDRDLGVADSGRPQYDSLEPRSRRRRDEDRDGPALATAEAREPAGDRGAGRSSTIRPAALDSAKDSLSARYADVRDRLDKLGGEWTNEKTSDGRRKFVRLEVPYPGDATQAKVFEAEDADDLQALTAVATQAERWLAGARRR
jgi:hypothetical protein